MTSFEDYALAHRRDVQCLASTDRLVRRQALERLASPVNHEFFLQEAQNGVFRLFADPVDRVREAAIDLVLSLYSGSSVSSDVTLKSVLASLPTVLPLMSSRLKSEPSEEIKLKLVSLLCLVLGYSATEAQIKRTVTDCTGEVLESVRLCLTDACPDLKKEACVAVNLLATVLSVARLSQNAPLLRGLVTALIGNTKHSHWRVRVVSITSICVLLSMQDASLMLLSDFVSDVFPFVANAVSDRQHQVRREVFKSLGTWLCGLIPLSGAVASMVDGQYVLIDSKKEDRCIQTLLFNLLIGLTDEDESVRLETQTALLAVARVFSHKTEQSEAASIADSVKVFLTRCRQDDFLMQIWSDETVAALLSHYKTGLLQQSLATAGVGSQTRRTLLVLSPWSVEILDSLVSLLILHSEDAEYAALTDKTAVHLDYVVPILAKNIRNYLVHQQFNLVNAALTILHRLLTFSAGAGFAADAAVALLEECVKNERVSVPRGVVSRLVGLCAETLLSGTVTGDLQRRLHSVLLQAESVDCLQNEIFTEDFFVTEAVSVSLPVLALLISRTSIAIVRPHLVTLVLPRLLLASDEEHKTQVLETLDVLFNKLARQDGRDGNTLAGREELEFVGRCVEEVVLGYIEWRPGQANAKIRRGALVVFIGVVDLIPALGAERILADHWNILKSAMDDNWVPDNRFAALLLVRKLLLILTRTQTETGFSLDMFREMYPELLKRLDDSQDGIRVEAATTLSVMFQLVGRGEGQDRLSKSSLMYIVKALLVHLEDANETVWLAVQEALEQAAAVNRQDTIAEIKAGEAKSSKPQRCASVLARIISN